MLLILRCPTDTPAAWQGTRTAHYNLPDAQGTEAKIRGREYGPHPGGGDKIDREVGRRSQHKFNSAKPTKEVNTQHRRWQGLAATSAGLPRAPESPLPKRNCSDRGGGLGWPTQRLAPHFVRPTAHPWLTSPLGEGGKRVHAAEPVADNQEAHEVKIKGHQHRFKPAQPT